jgi:hypothetical protein
MKPRASIKKTRISETISVYRKRMVRNLYCGFVTGWGNSWRNLMIRAKYALMRWQKVFYPDVYCLPPWIGGRCDFIATGKRIDIDRYDFIFAELNAGVGQLQYLVDLVEARPDKIVIILTPQEIFESYAEAAARGLAIRLLMKAGQVWAYSPELANFANRYAQHEVARVIPWPFDYARTRHLGHSRSNPQGEIRILMGVPLRFVGIAENAPSFLEDCLAEALAAMPPSERVRYKFYGMVYTKEDQVAWQRESFGRKIGAVLQPRKSYVKFLRFVGNCQAVITLPRFGVLGRITFIAAALGKPGIFTDNIALSRRLYPDSLVSSPMDKKLQDLTSDLLHGLADLGPLEHFLPDIAATKEVGNFAGNAARVRAMLEQGS